MPADDLNELQNPENWEDDGPVREPVKAPRAVVSVAFSREDFERIVNQAQQSGMKTSEFIRSTVLDAMEMNRPRVRIVSVGGLAFNDYPTNRTQTSREREASITGDATQPGFVTA